MALMNFHPEYFGILFELNIADEHKQDMFIQRRNELLSIVDSTEFSVGLLPQIQAVENITNLHDILRQLSRFDLKNQSANSGVLKLRQSMYESILYSEKEVKNTQRIYRVGTFLKYYISENNTRVFEDSLLTQFDEYIYDEDTAVSLQRFEKFDVGYILLDINAATIDRDPARSLTQRYEKMLTLLTSPDLELIETDSMCLRVALDTYKLDSDMRSYIDMASVNYPYKRSSQDKKAMCVQKIVEILSDTQQLSSYPYLSPYLASLERAKIPLSDSVAVGEALYQSIPNGYKVLLKIK